MTFNPFELEFLGLYDETCFEGVGCFDVLVVDSGAFPLSTGHSVTMAPLSIPGWQPKTCDTETPCAKGSCENNTCIDTGGFGGFVIVHTSLPDTPLSLSFLDSSGILQGDPDFARAKFKVLETLESNPAVFLQDALAVGPGGAGLQVSVFPSLLVSSQPN